jgi:hypothetical protein
MHRRPPLAPGSRLLELRRNANQQVFAADRSDQLNSNRRNARGIVSTDQAQLLRTPF